MTIQNSSYRDKNVGKLVIAMIVDAVFPNTNVRLSIKQSRADAKAECDNL